MEFFQPKLDEEIFHKWGIDIPISTYDTFTLYCIGTIIFLKIIKVDGTEIIVRRKVIDEDFHTEEFDVRHLSSKEKEDWVRRLKDLDVSTPQISRMLGINESSVGNYLRDK